MRPGQAEARARPAGRRSPGGRPPARRGHDRGTCGDRVECIGRVRELAHLRDTRPLRRREQKAVVGPDEHAPVGVGDRQWPPGAAHARIDDGEVDPHGHVRERAREDEGALQHLGGWDAVRHVDHPSVRRDPRDHAVAGPDEVVLEPEVGEEADDHSAAVACACSLILRGPPRTPGGSRCAHVDRRQPQGRATPEDAVPAPRGPVSRTTTSSRPSPFRISQCPVSG